MQGATHAPLNGSKIGVPLPAKYEPMSPQRSPSFLAAHVERLSRTHLRDLLKDEQRGE